MRLLQEVAKLCSQQCLVIHGQLAGPASRPAPRAHGHVQSPAWLDASPWPAGPGAMTQAFHLQKGRHGSCSLPTPSSLGPKAPPRPPNTSKADPKNWALLF